MKDRHITEPFILRWWFNGDQFATDVLRRPGPRARGFHTEKAARSYAGQLSGWCCTRVTLETNT